MVTLEPQFVATKYPGYFFNTQDHKLYSMKVDGVLKPLKFHRPNHFNHLWRYNDTNGGYQVSVKGRKRWLLIEELEAIKPHDATIPVREHEKNT
jgi:hypothetical protein